VGLAISLGLGLWISDSRLQVSCACHVINASQMNEQANRGEGKQIDKLFEGMGGVRAPPYRYMPTYVTAIPSLPYTFYTFLKLIGNTYAHP